MSSTDKDNSTSTTINQKEYLKKYLNIGVGSDKKKKKKKSKVIQNRLKIIDDNIDVLNSETLTANELDEFLTQEDAPQVVGVIDDRPLALRLDDYRKSSKWKLVGSDDEQNKNEISEKTKNKYESFKNTSSDSDRSPPRKTRKDYDSDVSPPRKRNSRKDSVDSDVSPVRKQKREDDSDASPPRKQRYRQEGSDSDVSPPRKSKNDSDTSPPRKIKLEIKHNSRFGSKLRNVSPPRHKINVTECVRKYDSDSDASPPRKNKPERNISPRREENQFKRKGASPMRRKTSNDSPSRGKNHKYRTSDSDVSPPRKNKSKDLDNSPKRKDKNNQPRKSRWSDNSPPRHKTNSPPNNKISDYKHKSEEKRYSDYKNKYSSRENKESSKRDKPSERYSKYFTEDRSELSNKMEKTLDGKSAGLQNAEELKHETLAFKKREEDLFKKMSEEVSGRNAATIIRDRKTGKKRDFVKEAEEEFARLKKQQEQKEKYDKWGKGLKQVEDLKEKIESDLHEMSKPLARYADDEDLERFLKEQEREGDPMLQYIRKKKRKQAAAEGRPMKPVYEGEFMPNRFGIPPGHRWDGVDRSNGYEKKWFAKENAKKAVEEEVYKWSTEDM